MFIRIISGVIGAMLVIAIVVFNSSLPWIVNVVVFIVGIMAGLELFLAVGISRYYRIIIPSLIFSGLFPIIPLGIPTEFLLWIYTLILFVQMVIFSENLTIKDISVIYSVTLIISFSLKFLISIRDMGGESLGGFYALFALATAWFADTGAYFFGSFFGKTKLCEKISPKKTVEGAVGGLFFCMIALNLLVFITKEFFLGNSSVYVNYLAVTGIAVIGSVLAIIGDLVFSIVKRGCHIKDFGHIIPGHGGILDRIDSVVFVVPFVYFALKVIPIVC